MSWAVGTELHEHGAVRQASRLGTESARVSFSSMENFLQIQRCITKNMATNRHGIW
eukprot:CAMPEP_0198426960 /NCGR_PEP_ID=MMETSP1452-20131203/5599_1 /TAXON_ID=1181717 /ORGANISM="Synchroma pusillum, Strain CCMP3072" /LENGTH=55 /DNA_ID=CAMNT_0044147337 /DNA_START=15 /DNA_END=179 /DNA_ORIENTATION=+